MAVGLTRALLLIVGLGPGAAVSGVRGRRGGPLVVGVELVGRACCGGCGGKVHRHGAGKAGLAGLPAFGRPVRLEWNKRRWLCPDEGCAVRAFAGQDPAVAPPRARMTSRAARWATRRAGLGRAIKETAAELGCNWHTAMAAVHRWGRALLGADPGRIEGVTALGLDEILMFRRGPFRRKHWGTAIVDVRRGVLPGHRRRSERRGRHQMDREPHAAVAKTHPPGGHGACRGPTARRSATPCPTPSRSRTRSMSSSSPTRPSTT